MSAFVIIGAFALPLIGGTIIGRLETFETQRQQLIALFTGVAFALGGMACIADTLSEANSHVCPEVQP